MRRNSPPSGNVMTYDLSLTSISLTRPSRVHFFDALSCITTLSPILRGGNARKPESNAFFHGQIAVHPVFLCKLIVNPSVCRLQSWQRCFLSPPKHKLGWAKAAGSRRILPFQQALLEVAPIPIVFLEQILACLHPILSMTIRLWIEGGASFMPHAILLAVFLELLEHYLFL